MKKQQNHNIKVGMFVGHTSQYGMGKMPGRVIAEAGMRYGRRYVWVNYTANGKTYNSAFWDDVLLPTDAYSVVLPPTVESTSYDMWS